MTARQAYEWLRADSVETSYLASTEELIAWDQRTNLPTKGAAHRTEQLAVLARLLHGRACNPRIGDELARVEGTQLVADPASEPAVNVREWRRNYDRAIKIPERLAVALARATADGESAWEQARPKNDWTSFQPHLERILSLLKEQADALGYAAEPYDALLDIYERSETARALEHTFEELRLALVQLLGRIKGSSVAPRPELLARDFPVVAQQGFCRTIASALGYDLEGGRLDVSAHPFTIGIGPGDVRITTRFLPRSFNASLFGTLHESGHAMYEQGLPTEHWGTPLGQPVSLGIHESQSRLWENFVGRSKGFWRYALPLAKAEFASLDGVTLDDFILAINAVRPSLIRVEADEVTYNLHILLRFELELALMRGALAVADVPEAWREKAVRYLGVEPHDMASGALQDVHWSAGLIGYFPTYTLGNLYAAQLYRTAEAELGDLEEQFAAGEFSPLLSWLRERVHQPGSTYLPRELIQRVTGEDLQSRYLIDYCNTKYGRLYGI